MQNWKKPTIIKYEKSMITRTITAKAYSLNEAMTVGDLCAKGIGASGIVLMPNGLTEHAYVAAVNEVECFFTLVVNGVKRFWNWVTGVFS